MWDSHGNAAAAARSTGKGRFYTFLASSLDRFLGKRVDALITVSKADAEAYEAMGVPAARLHVIPTCVNAEEAAREADRAAPVADTTAKKLIFFGSYKYAPNLEALRYINARLAPYLEKEGLGCEIFIAGRDLPRMDFHPSIKPVGFVENIYALLRQADLCVVPIWSGVGILTKVVDTMATGTPLVMSRLATMGIPEIRDGVHALVAESPEDLPRLVASALRNPQQMQEIARNARRLVEERYDWRVQEPLLEELLTGVVRAKGGLRNHGG